MLECNDTQRAHVHLYIHHNLMFYKSSLSSTLYASSAPDNTFQLGTAEMALDEPGGRDTLAAVCLRCLAPLPFDPRFDRIGYACIRSAFFPDACIAME
jgi:hypothetical protein